MLKQLDAIITEYGSLKSKAMEDDLSDLPYNDVIRLITRSRAVIERISGKISVYNRQSEEIVKNGGYSGYICSQIMGVVDSLRVDVEAGSTLESHLRNLCDKASIKTTFKRAGKEVNKKADTINANLTKEDIYSKLDQKNITAWLDLRNKAAHGHYDEYTKEQVSLLIESIGDFIARKPA